LGKLVTRVVRVLVRAVWFLRVMKKTRRAPPSGKVICPVVGKVVI